MTDKIHDDGIQHGIDDDPRGDAEKGAALGGMGGAVVGGVAGSMAGPVGTVIGAVAGATAGAVASGAAVAAVDAVDNDNTVTGVGEGVTPDAEAYNDEVELMDEERDIVVTPADAAYGDAPDRNVANNYRGDYEHGDDNLPGVQTGGITSQGEDTRGITEKAADAVTGDKYDDKTGGRVL